MSTRTTAERSGRRRGLATRTALAAALSAGVNAAIVLLADALGVAPEFRALTLPPVVFLSVVGAAGAAGAYAVLRRVIDRPDRRFLQLAAAVLLLSFVPDLALPFVDETATPAGVVVLMVMHVTVAAICVRLIPEDGWSP